MHKEFYNYTGIDYFDLPVDKRPDVIPVGVYDIISKERLFLGYFDRTGARCNGGEVSRGAYLYTVGGVEGQRLQLPEGRQAIRATLRRLVRRRIKDAMKGV